ncbi:MAG: hypothetical protein ACOCUL_04785 [Bacteroidota bacterium]
MAVDDKKNRELLVNTLSEKPLVKRLAYKNTLEAFAVLKNVLTEVVEEYNMLLKNDIQLEYNEKGKCEAELKLGDDSLLFSMYNHVFEFSREHHIWKNSYVQKTEWSTFCGIINVYNFLSDSLKYRRIEDLGYLIARIFINKDMHYFVEGKRQLGFLYNDFANAVVNKSELKKIVFSAILYSLEFDLLVPPYDNVKIISVAQIFEKINDSRIQTGKRLGFTFNSDDVLEEK